MTYSESQQIVIDRYLEATKDHPEDRIPISKLLGMRRNIPKSKPDKEVLAKCESDYLSTDTEATTAGRKGRIIDNRYVQGKLSKCNEYYLATNNWYWIDDVFTGVSRLDLGGNTRPLSKYKLYDCISQLTVITTDILMQAYQLQIRQAQKMLLALVIVNRMLTKEFIRIDDVLVQDDKST